MGRRKAKASWGKLPHELWAIVFQHLEPQPFYVGTVDRPWLDYDTLEAYSLFFQVQLVCKKFRHVFAQQPHFYRYLLLPACLEVEHLSSVANWIQCHGASVETTIAGCSSPWLVVALAALQHQQAPLTHAAVLKGTTTAAVEILSMFSGLTKCTLSASRTEIVSLRAMEALPNLTLLHLSDGNYSRLDAAQHLTHISLLDASATTLHDCHFVTSLLELNLRRSDIIGFHSRGLAACLSLQALDRFSSSVQTADPSLCIHAQAHDLEDVMFASISNLSKLTQLSLGICNEDAIVDLAWLGQLRFLRSLRFNFNVQQVKLPPSLAELDRLARLSMTGGCFKVNFD